MARAGIEPATPRFSAVCCADRATSPLHPSRAAVLLRQDQLVFSVEDRARIREHVLVKGRNDPRVVSGAEVGSLATGGGDRWSDLDLTFAVVDDVPVDGILGDWTRDLIDELDAVHLFDLPSPPTIYRVFLLPGLLQMDVSFAPASRFYPRSPKFRLVFGEAAGEPRFATPPSAAHLFGLAVHHALRARIYIERGKTWQAEYWIAELRRHVFDLACLRLGRPTSYGRGFDDLPSEVSEPLEHALVGSLGRDELVRTLRVAVECLLREGPAAGDLAARAEPPLRALAGDEL